MMVGLALSMVACGGSPPPLEPRAEHEEVCVEPAPEPEPTAPRRNRCEALFEDEGVAGPTPPEVAARCADNPAGEHAMRARLEREYHRAGEPSRVDVSFDCDPLGADLRFLRVVQQVDFQLASYFTVARFTRPEGEGDVEVRAIRLELAAVEPDEMTWTNARQGTFRRFVGTIPRRAFDAAVPSIRAAVLARTREVELPHRGARTIIAPRVGAVRSPFAIRLADADERALVRAGTTATSGPAQREQLGPTIALQTLIDLLEEHASWETARPDADDAQLVRQMRPGTGRWRGPGFLATASVTEHQLLGSTDLLAALEPFPEEPALEPHGPLGVRSWFFDRARVLALAEIARRTGWDLQGDSRPIGELAAEVLAECRAAEPAAIREMEIAPR